ncbi:hypothetical protein Taro_001404, partial [Colocasia esculenta]|nr:hypothetical protein [Colocasia esculenta]
MASQNVTLASPPAAHVVGKAFVEQYYHILHLSPDMVHKFYQDSSLLARPGLDGAMSSAINEKVMSLNYEDYKFEIETVDAQESFKGGVLVLVTGSLVGKDNILRKFTQSFFLAPQDEGGYFVLNDVFRYVRENQTKENNSLLDDVTHDFATKSTATSDPVYHVTENTKSSPDEDTGNGAEVSNQLENGQLVVEEESVEQPVKLSCHDAPPAPEVTTAIEEEVPKKSYASIVKVMKGSSTPSNVYVPTTKVKVTAPTKTEKQASEAIAVPAPEAAAPCRNDGNESSNPHDEAEGHSIYIRSLPQNATPADVVEEFKKFGPIKVGGVQVRNHRQFGYCFGFVEFESESSMQAAIELMVVAAMPVAEDSSSWAGAASGMRSGFVMITSGGVVVSMADKVMSGTSSGVEAGSSVAGEAFLHEQLGFIRMVAGTSVLITGSPLQLHLLKV